MKIDGDKTPPCLTEIFNIEGSEGEDLIWGKEWPYQNFNKETIEAFTPHLNKKKQGFGVNYIKKLVFLTESKERH